MSDAQRQVAGGRWQGTNGSGWSQGGLWRAPGSYTQARKGTTGNYSRSSKNNNDNNHKIHTHTHTSIDTRASLGGYSRVRKSGRGGQVQKELAAFQRDTEICLSNDAQHLLVDQSTSGEVVHFFQGWRTLAFLPLSPLPCVIPLVSFPVLQCRRGEKGIKERRRRKDKSKILAFQGLR